MVSPNPEAINIDLGRGLTLSWERITPERAEELLTTNTKNRRPKPERIDKYAQAMLDGEWGGSLNMIKISAKGYLMNGQHRLMACVRAGVPFCALVVFGFERGRHRR